MNVPTTIGFIGLGNMGWPMAARLAKAGHEMVVADASPERAKSFVETVGGMLATTPAEIGTRAKVVVTMLPTSAVVESVLIGPAGLLSTLSKGSVVVEMSSGAPSYTRKLADDVARAGSTLVDAPVSGGVSRAADGNLAIMVGGSEEVIGDLQPILSILGNSVVRTGPIGSAHAMKALNNLASAAGLLVTVEVLLIGAKFGLDPTLMVDVLNASTGMNNSTQKKIKPFVLSRRFDAGFGLDLMVKDLTTALELAHETHTSVPFSALCREVWAAAATTLGPGRDHTEIARMSELLAGAELTDASTRDTTA